MPLLASIILIASFSAPLSSAPPIAAPPPPVTYTLPITDFMSYFAPLSLTEKFTLPVSLNPIYPIIGPIAATVVSLVMQKQIITTYISVRLGLLAFMFIIDFIMTKIGRPLPRGNEVVIAGRHTGYKVPKLPSLGPGIGGGGRRGRI